VKLEWGRVRVIGARLWPASLLPDARRMNRGARCAGAWDIHAEASKSGPNKVVPVLGLGLFSSDSGPFPKNVPPASRGSMA
jgi:hypothetical protein